MFIYYGFKLCDYDGQILVIYPGNSQKVYFATISKAKQFINNLLRIGG